MDFDLKKRFKVSARLLELALELRMQPDQIALQHLSRTIKEAPNLTMFTPNK